MKKIYIADMTLGNASKQLPSRLSFKEKLEIARNLDKLGVDVMELCAIEDAKTDSLLIRTISSFVKNSTVSIAAGMTEDSVAEAWNAVAQAAKPRLTVTIPVSPALMEYSCHAKPSAMLELTAKLVAKCASLCGDVELRAADATRAESDFLKSVIETAIKSGATVVTVCDNEGISLPAETDAFIKRVSALMPASGKVRLGYMCENGYGLGLSSLVTAAISGASEIKIAVGSSLYTSAERFAEFIKNRGDSLKLSTSLNKTELGRIAKQISWIVSEKRGEHSAFDKFAITETVQSAALTKKDDVKTVAKAVKKLGYELDADDVGKVFEAFMRVAEKKKEVSVRELDVIVASVALEVPQTYKIVSYVINSGNIMTASANVTLEKSGETLQGISLGDGPIDAAILAIEHIIGRHYELDDFQIQAVTEGREAMGSALVKLREQGRLYSGQGISTDIVGAAIRAYMSAVNKIIYEENNK